MTVTSKSTRRNVLPETTLMAAICVFDAILTIYLVYMGKANEANPILAWSLQHGSVPFMLTKLASFVPALAIIELTRPRIGAFVQQALRAGVLAYLAFYAIGVLVANRL